jgi:predicted nucleotidyltransferase
MSQKTVLKIAGDYVLAVKQHGIPVSAAYLFGSYARKNPHLGSDIDVCIISPTLGNDLIDEMMMLGRITLEVDLRIEPHPMSPADFAEKYNLLAHEIKTYGIPLVTTHDHL